MGFKVLLVFAFTLMPMVVFVILPFIAVAVFVRCRDCFTLFKKLVTVFTVNIARVAVLKLRCRLIVFNLGVACMVIGIYSCKLFSAVLTD